MRLWMRNPWLSSLGLVLAVMTFVGARASADVVDDRAGSIVSFPKVIADGTRDTLIIMKNTGNTMAYAHCEYIQGTGWCSNAGVTPGEGFCTQNRDCIIPDGPPGVCDVDWLSSDFEIMLTKQQPTIWRVSTGRAMGIPPIAPPVGCTPTDVPSQVCPGIFPMLVPNPSSGQFVPGNRFRGQLWCFQTDAEGTPIAANKLEGVAVIETLRSPLLTSISLQGRQISVYNAVSIVGNMMASAAAPQLLKLNCVDPTDDTCNYNACPEALEAIHYGRGRYDMIADDAGACEDPGCPVRTEITVAPCRINFENEEGFRFNALVDTWDETEVMLSSAAQRAQCWLNGSQEQFGVSPSPTRFVKTVISSQASGLCIQGSNFNFLGCTEDSDCGVDGVCGPAPGLLAIVEEFHTATDFQLADAIDGSAATVFVSAESNNEDGNVNRRGECRGSLADKCDNDQDCLDLPAYNSGLCRLVVDQPCLTDEGCQTSNAQCTAAGVPALCCTGNLTGDCTVVAGDFCDICMNDEILLAGF